MFTGGVTAALNRTISRADIARNSDDPAERDRADRSIRALARTPVYLGHLRRLADALT